MRVSFEEVEPLSLCSRIPGSKECICAMMSLGHELIWNLEWTQMAQNVLQSNEDFKSLIKIILLRALT